MVSKLLIERQREKNAVPTPVVAATDNAEQLQKVKALLDNGIIAQEAFDAKKNRS